MSYTIRKLARGISSFWTSRTPLLSQIVFDTTLNRLRIGDGATAGGLLVANVADLPSSSRTTVGNANYAITTSDLYIALNAILTAIRTLTLPAANAVPAGRVITIQDEAGGVSQTFYHLIAPAGTDTINGAAGNWVQKTKRGAVTLRSDGASNWSVQLDRGRSVVSDTAYTATMGDSVIAYASITAARAVTLPAASAFPVGQRLTIVDESGSASATNTITINRAGADTINGAASQVINQARGYIALVSDGSSKWTIVDSSVVSGSQVVGGVINNVPIGSTTAAAGSFTTLSASGSATFSGGLTQGAAVGVVTISNGGMAFGGTAPLLAGYVSGGGADQKYWDWSYGSATLQGRAANDAYSSSNPWITVNRGSGFTISNVSFPVQVNVTSASATAFAVGRQGTTNPGLNVDASIANCVTGINIRSLVAGNGSLVQAISSGANENLAFDAKGAGVVFLGANSTGGVNLASGGGPTVVNGASTLTGQLTLNATPFVIPAHCRLVRQDATHLKLVPYNGNMIKIAGNMYPIPAAGITLANGTFAAGTFYYIYALQTGGVVSLENSTTGHSTDSTAGNVGVEIKTGDNTRSLVGAVLVDGAASFFDSDTNRWTLSWLNRQPKRLRNQFTAARSTTSATFVEINSEIRCNFLAWADDLPSFTATGQVSGSTTNTTAAAISVDGVAPSGTVNSIGPNIVAFSTNWAQPVSEGAGHYATLFGGTSSGTGNYPTSSVSSGGFCELHGTILG